MAELRVIGQVAGYEDAETRITILPVSDWRDERGVLPPPVYLFRAPPGGAYQTPTGEAGIVLGSDDPAYPPPVVDVTYTVRKPGGLPFARTVRRRIFTNTEGVGVWDFTLPDAQAPVWGGGSGVRPSVNVLPGVGPQGEAGASFRVGAGAPPASLGNIGDAYFNSLNRELHVKTGAEVWEYVATLGGSVGPKGEDGRPGLPGASFPKPVTVNTIPVSDGSQPSGFSWHDLASLNLGAKKLSQLKDVRFPALRGLHDFDVLSYGIGDNLWYATTPADLLQGAGLIPVALAQSQGIDLPLTLSILIDGEGKASLTYRDNVGNAYPIRGAEDAPAPTGPVALSTVRDARGVRSPEGTPGSSGFGIAHYRLFVPETEDIWVTGMKDVTQQEQTIRGVIWDVDDTSAPLARTPPVSMEDQQAASPYLAAFDAPVKLLKGKRYFIGWVSEDSGVIRSGNAYDSAPNYSGFQVMVNASYYPPSVGSYPGQSINGYPASFTLAAYTEQPKGVAGPSDPGDAAIIRKAEDCPGPGAAILDTGDAPPRWVYRASPGGPLWYGLPMTDTP